MTDISLIAQTFLSGFFDIDGRGTIESVVSRNVRVTGVEGLDIRGRVELLRFHNMVWCQVDLLKAEPVVVLRDPPWISYLCDLSLREGRSGIAARDRFQITMRIEGGRIVEIVAFVNFLALFETIGRLPPRTLDRCLAGEVMRAV
ncbi:hypothetical protein OCH239_03395 [Roseivivax halodurans JCM 10272]|uniref:SnoaL-like domain-containing protein n=1 Tax=Roseivivax halodurans JCM 10272 TaxID=1449350 RepID=X7EEU4_9RHOB|nr:hypothetical protein [Roseivivax halodurans]ETX14422.1 hypothetical protein OCH239_03395 [Roseivivax halodurans JCM 10272]